MKITLKNFFLLAASLYIVETNINCAASVVAAVFIPLIGAVQWQNSTNADNTFFFTVVTQNSNTSTFSGNENLVAGGQASFKGSFTNHNMQFTYDADQSKKGTYQGYVNDASTEIKLTSSTSLPALTLIKQ